jgi:4-nitrophenyl phosphatase
VDGLVCDLDGVVYRGEAPIPGAIETLARLRARGTRLVLCTNNSASTTSQYRAKLAGMGLDVSEDEILTSAVVTAETLAARGMQTCRALVIGEQGLRESLTGIGMRLVRGRSRVDVVVVGLDRTFHYGRMRRALQALDAHAAFVASNDDATLPMPHGRRWPGAGAILASIEAASGRKAEVMGKPHAPMMDAAERRLADADEVAIVGDRPETDLLGGARKGWRTILVLSGVTTRERAVSLDPAPDEVLDSVAELR